MWSGWLVGFLVDVKAQGNIILASGTVTNLPSSVAAPFYTRNRAVWRLYRGCTDVLLAILSS